MLSSLILSYRSYVVFDVPVLCSLLFLFFFLMIRRPPRSTLDRSSAASDVYKRQVLASYNAGEGKVKQWVKNFAQADMLTFIERIPYQETRTYVKLVLRNYSYYKSCLLYTSPSPRDRTRSRMPSSA